MRHLLLILSLFFLHAAKSQNIFAPSVASSQGKSSSQKTNPATKFEQYIKLEVEKRINAEKKVLLLNLKNSLPFLTYDSTISSVIHNKYVLLTKGNEDYWIATCYLEVSSKTRLGELKIMKSKEVNIPENSELYKLKQNWDSLEFNIYLPFVYSVERNGKAGYSPENYVSGQNIYFYAIDKNRKVFKTLDNVDACKEWSWHHFKNVNINYDFNYSQQSFAALIYVLELYRSNTLFSEYGIQ